MTENAKLANDGQPFLGVGRTQVADVLLHPLVQVGRDTRHLVVVLLQQTHHDETGIVA